MKKYFCFLFLAMTVNSELVKAAPPLLVLATGDSYTRRTGECKANSWQGCWDENSKEGMTSALGIGGANINQVSYANYLNAATLYTVASTVNSARGGETCGDFSTATTYQYATEPSTGNSLAYHIPAREYGGGVFVDPNTGSKLPQTGLLKQVTGGKRISSDVKVVSLLLGVNDIAFTLSDPVNVSIVSGKAIASDVAYASMSSNLTKCLKELITAFFGPKDTKGDSIIQKVIVMTYPPVDDNVNPWGISNANVGIVNIVNPAIRAAVDSLDSTKVDLSKVFLADMSEAWSASEVGRYTSDGAHPNALGAWKLAREWAKKVCVNSASGISCSY